MGGAIRHDRGGVAARLRRIGEGACPALKRSGAAASSRRRGAEGAPRKGESRGGNQGGGGAAEEIINDENEPTNDDYDDVERLNSPVHEIGSGPAVTFMA